MLCPCHSQKPYQECCRPFHDGALPERPVELMRSRYAAYSLGLCDYLIQTTHPEHKNYSKDLIRWKQEITAFSEATSFDGLTIIETTDGEERAYVTFRAHLSQGKKDISFTEKSLFIKQGRWLYREGQIL